MTNQALTVIGISRLTKGDIILNYAFITFMHVCE